MIKIDKKEYEEVLKDFLEEISEVLKLEGLSGRDLSRVGGIFKNYVFLGEKEIYFNCITSTSCNLNAIMKVNKEIERFIELYIVDVWGVYPFETYGDGYKVDSLIRKLKKYVLVNRVKDEFNSMFKNIFGEGFNDYGSEMFVCEDFMDEYSEFKVLNIGTPVYFVDKSHKEFLYFDFKNLLFRDDIDISKLK